MVTDPIADLITQIKNAGAVGKASITVPFSALKSSVAQVLEKEGYVGSVTTRGRKVKKSLEIGIKYHEGKPRVTGAERISKPSRRVYVGAEDIKPVRQGHGRLILSTPQGIVTGMEAQKAHSGGEVLFKIW